MRSLVLSVLSLSATTLLAACASAPESAQPVTENAPANSTTEPTTTVPATSTTATPTTPAPSDSIETNSESTAAATTIDLEAVVQELGIETLVVEINGIIHALDNGTLTNFAPGADIVPWSDGEFLYWSTSSDDSNITSTIADLDGTLRCETPDRVAEAELVDGAVIATVWEPIVEFDDEPVEIPYFSLDCATGERTPINSRVTYGLDSQSSFIQQVGDRTFRGSADAEGNANVINEQGISLNGEDYAGSHTFSPDGSAVIYGDMAALAGPHFSDTLSARDTQTGDLLWTTQLDNPFISIHHNNEFVVVGLLDSSELFNSFDLTSALVVLDAATGEITSTVDVETNVLFAG